MTPEMGPDMKKEENSQRAMTSIGAKAAAGS